MTKRYRSLFLPILVAVLLGVALLVHVIQVRCQSTTTASQFTIPAHAGHAYIVELVSTPNSSLTYAQITANPATAPRSMGTRTIGVL